MPDIFGLEREDYAHIRAIDEQLGDGAWEQSQRAQVQRFGGGLTVHNFDALGRAGVDNVLMRAPQDAQALGYVTNNMLAIQAVADEILYTDYRLPDFVAINSSIPEGARTYGVRVRDRKGNAARVTAPGYDAPSATVSESLVTQELHYYGLDAIWSIDEIREAMFGGVPLDTESVDAAIRGEMETMEATALTGGEYGDLGLLNLRYNSGPSADRVLHETSDQEFSAMTSQEIRNLINGEISSLIESSKETMGRNVRAGMTVYLPGPQYDLLTTRYIGDNADKTLMKAILEDNPWTHFTKGQPLMIERVLELAEIGASGSDRMVISLRNPRICEMGVSINPRVIRILDHGRVIKAQTEAKFSTLFVKRPKQIKYVDGI